MNMWDVLIALISLAMTGWLLARAWSWWFLGSLRRDLSRPDRHAERMADWQARVDDRQQQLDYYLQNPNWFDLEWPVCGSLSVSEDGEYCTNCFRQVHEHLVGVGVA